MHIIFYNRCTLSVRGSTADDELGKARHACMEEHLSKPCRPGQEQGHSCFVLCHLGLASVEKALLLFCRQPHLGPFKAVKSMPEPPVTVKSPSQSHHLTLMWLIPATCVKNTLIPSSHGNLMEVAAWVSFQPGDTATDIVFAQVRAGIMAKKHLARATDPMQAALLPQNYC